MGGREDEAAVGRWVALSRLTSPVLPLPSYLSRLTSHRRGLGGVVAHYHKCTNTAGRTFWPVVPVERSESAYAASLTICSRLPPFRNKCKF